MAYNVFGNPITNFTLKGIPEYADKEEIGRKDRARVALNLKNAQEKDRNAREYVEKLKEEWGTGVCTLCLVYNATGDPLRLETYHDWFGHLGPAPLPVRLENGQWGGFLHVKTTATATGSEAAIVYRGLDQGDQICQWLAAWSNPWNRGSSWDNKAYTETNLNGRFDNDWGRINKLLQQSNLYASASSYYNDGYMSIVSTGSSTTAVFEAIFTLENAL